MAGRKIKQNEEEIEGNAGDGFLFKKETPHR